MEEGKPQGCRRFVFLLLPSGDLTRWAGSRDTARSRPGEEARIQPKLLLIDMPDKASCFDRLIDMPNLGICSIAGNVEDLTNHIRILDLSLHRKNIARIVERELSVSDPDVVGSRIGFRKQPVSVQASILRFTQRRALGETIYPTSRALASQSRDAASATS